MGFSTGVCRHLRVRELLVDCRLLAMPEDLQHYQPISKSRIINKVYFDITDL